MSSPYVIGVDIGTTTCKGILLDAHGNVKAYSEHEIRIYRPKPLWAEHNPYEWWSALKRVIGDLISLSGVDPDYIKGISVSSTEEGIVPVSEDGEPLYNCMIWQDQRTIRISEELKNKVDERRVLEITGLPIAHYWSSSKVLWLKKYMPKVYNEAYMFLQPKDYIVYRLTGIYVTDWSIAGHTQLVDIRKLNWSKEIMEEFGIPIDKWPTIKSPFDLAGYIRKEVADELKLSPKTIVAVGSGDQESGVIGAGVTKESLAFESAGTASVLNICVSKPLINERINIFPHPVRGLWIIELYPSPTGEALKWLKNLMAHLETIVSEYLNLNPYEIMNIEAEKSPPGSRGLIFLPFLSGRYYPEMNPYAKGVLYGLTYDHTKGDIIRALMEGTAFELREILEFCKSELNITINELRVSGGVSRSKIWRKIRASVTGVDIIKLRVDDATLLGDAIIAAVASKTVKSLEEIVKTWIRIEEIDRPNPIERNVYDKLYQVYKELYTQLKPVFISSSRLEL